MMKSWWWSEAPSHHFCFYLGWNAFGWLPQPQQSNFKRVCWCYWEGSSGRVSSCSVMEACLVEFCVLGPPPRVLEMVPETFLSPFMLPSAPGRLKKPICFGISGIILGGWGQQSREAPVTSVEPSQHSSAPASGRLWPPSIGRGWL